MTEHLGINTPYFGILVSLTPFVIAAYFYRRTDGFLLLAPLFVSMVAGIAFLGLTGISYGNYKIGGGIINFLLEPATICFAIPLYRKREVLKKYWLQIFGGIAVGTTIALLLVYPVAMTFQFDNQIITSILPQAATAAVALPVSDDIGGVRELASLTVILNAAVIPTLGAKIVKLFKTPNLIARGLALGTSGHALGVAAAKELGKTGESMESITVVIVGVIVVAVVPILAPILL